MSINSLAIFGDSYGAEEPGAPWSWVEKIKSRYLKVDVYAEGGASLGWIYTQFLNHHKDYDKVIFLFTSGFRFYFPFEYTRKTDNQKIKVCHWGGLSDVLTVEQQGRDYDKEHLNFLKQYFINLVLNLDEPNNFLLYEHNLNSTVVAAIKTTRPDCILIPCFDHYWKYTKDRFENLFDPYTWCLFDISESENLNLENPIKDYPIKDHRANHLSPTNNGWLFNHIIKRLEFNEFEEWKKPNVN